MSIDREVKVGIRIDMPPAGKGISLFGAEEVNKLISDGWRVLSIQPGGAIITKLNQHDRNVTMVVSGRDMKVILSPPA